MGYPKFAPNVVPAMQGTWRLWMHECGHVELWENGTAPTDGGCDACESGSDRAADWRPLFVESKSEQPRAVECPLEHDCGSGECRHPELTHPAHKSNYDVVGPGQFFGADAHGGAPDGIGSLPFEGCDWPAEQCSGHYSIRKLPDAHNVDSTHSYVEDEDFLCVECGGLFSDARHHEMTQ